MPQSLESVVLNPLSWTDEQIARYVFESDSFGDSDPDPNYIENLLVSLKEEKAIIERRAYGFAIIHRMLEADTKARPKAYVLSHFIVEAVEVFGNVDMKNCSKKLFEELVEKYAKVAPLRGICSGKARARLFHRRYKCVVTEIPNTPHLYDVLFSSAR